MAKTKSTKFDAWVALIKSPGFGGGTVKWDDDKPFTVYTWDDRAFTLHLEEIK